MRWMVGVLISMVFVGCGDSRGSENLAQSEVADTPESSTFAGPARTARCEGLGPDANWRGQAVSVGSFGLLAPDPRLVEKNRNGDFVAKMGAVVEGDDPITVRVPEADRERVRLAYAGTAEATRLAKVPVEVTFVPCKRRDPTGYVGGLLLDSPDEAVTLEVRAPDRATRTLVLEP
jgi:hypothetical protein